MRKDVVGTVASRTSPGRWPVGLSSAAQLLGECAAGIVAGAPGVLAYRSVLIAAEQRGEITLRSLNRSGSWISRRPGCRRQPASQPGWSSQPEQCQRRSDRGQRHLRDRGDADQHQPESQPTRSVLPADAHGPAPLW